LPLMHWRRQPRMQNRLARAVLVLSCPRQKHRCFTRVSVQILVAPAAATPPKTRLRLRVIVVTLMIL
jgi:hypothetical protein